MLLGEDLRQSTVSSIMIEANIRVSFTQMFGIDLTYNKPRFDNTSQLYCNRYNLTIANFEMFKVLLSLHSCLNHRLDIDLQNDSLLGHILPDLW